MNKPHYKQILAREKEKLNHKLPLNLHYIVLPLLRFQLDRQIKKYFTKYRLKQKLSGYQQTFTKCIVFASDIYRLNPFSRKIFKDFLNQISEPGFLALLRSYGDTFGAFFIEELRENLMSQQDLILLVDRTKELQNFYLSKKSQNIYKKIHIQIKNDTKKLKKLETSFAGSFAQLLNNRKILDNYFELVQQITEDCPQNAVEFLHSMQAIAHYLGTTKSYEAFWQFAEKLHILPNFAEILEIAQKITIYRKPDLFQDVFYWAASSELSHPNIAMAFSYAAKLLDNPVESANAAFQIEKYIQYLIEREERLKQMEEEDIQYYLKKAMEFFLEG